MNQPATVNQRTARPFDERLFTADDFSRMIECGAFEDMHVELVGGVLERIAPAHGDHGSTNLNVGVQLHKAYEGLPYWLATDLAIKVDDLEVRGADVSVVREGTPKDRLVEGREVLLAVEIAKTTLGGDLGDKVVGYARAGVSHYWVVDLKARVIHIMSEPSEAEYEKHEVVAFGTMLTPPAGGKPVVIA